MKLGSVPKPDKRNTATSKKLDNDVISAIYDFLVIFPIFGQIGVIRNPESERMVCKTQISINSNQSPHTTALNKGTIFAKNADFLKKYTDINKRGLHTKRYVFRKYIYVCVITHLISGFAENAKEFQTGVILQQ